MSLLSLPNELLLIIADFLPTAKSTLSLLLTTRHLSLLLTPRLHYLATKPYSGLAALTWASSRGHAPLIKLLVTTKHHDINTPDNLLGQPPLHHAISPRISPSIPALLVSLGADVRYRTNSGRDALHVAVRQGQVETARMLIAHGASVNTRDGGGHTALYLAAYVAAPGMVRCLLECGADVDIKNADGRTALHCVMLQGYAGGFNRSLAAVLEVLLKWGADLGVRSDDGYTARDVAVLKGMHRVVGILDRAVGTEKVYPTATVRTAAVVKMQKV